jgi:hydroxymethylpyrimidine/phosphomethylpyrimidine kinase
MLASAETIRVVARALQEHHVKLTVVDPVWFNRSRDSSDEGFSDEDR